MQEKEEEEASHFFRKALGLALNAAEGDCALVDKARDELTYDDQDLNSIAAFAIQLVFDSACLTQEESLIEALLAQTNRPKLHLSLVSELLQSRHIGVISLLISNAPSLDYLGERYHVDAITNPIHLDHFDAWPSDH